MAAVQKCDLSSLLQAGKCFACFSTLQNQAAIVYFLSQRFAKLNGTAVPTPGALRASVQALKASSINATADNLDAAVAQAGAVAAGVPGASTQTIAQIGAAILPFANMSLTDLRAIEVLLRCQLNQFP